MRSLLVANRGEIASRVFRTAGAMGMNTVAVFSDADADLPFVHDADQAVRLPGNTAAETYLRDDLIIEAALRTGAAAIHPGYGFLSENARFARAVLNAGLIWVGPPPDAIEAMGSKLRAKQMMRNAGVPTLPWAEQASAAGAAEVGYPLLVKASAGGGGRGMRIVRRPEELDAAVEGASREAAGAFGDATVFLERYLEAPRHVEIQIFADGHGNVVSLFERECSIQRRHQKIVEEAPSPAVDAVLRRTMGEAAVAAAREVSYVGAGTVEFVLSADRSFYFLEMNTRLQVEHPVTELVTGLDLVRLQLMVASGVPLPPEVLSPILRGYAIEVRLYAEDPESDFLPATGTLRQFEIPRTVRVDAGVESGSLLSSYYDAMLAKVVAHAPTRGEAASSLANALGLARIHGVATNRELLVGILNEDDFLAGSTDTGYLERHDVARLSVSRPATRDGQVAHAIAAAMARQAHNRAQANVATAMPSGWRNNPSQPQRVELVSRGSSEVVSYQFGRGGVLVVDVNGDDVSVALRSTSATRIDADIDGVRRIYDVVVDPAGTTVDVDSPLGSSSYAVVPRFPDPSEAIAAGSLVAPMPGTVVRVLIEAGAAVTKGQPLVVLEAMKMEHTVTSPAAGTMADLRVEPGQQVDAGAILAVVDHHPRGAMRN